MPLPTMLKVNCFEDSKNKTHGEHFLNMLLTIAVTYHFNHEDAL